MATEPVHSLLIVEDEPDVLTRMVELFDRQPGFEVVASADNKADGMLRLAESTPDILLTDLGLPDGSGVELIKAIRELRLDTQAMVISGFQDERQVFSALSAGASGYILKQDNSQDIVESVQLMLEGGAPVSPVIARLMLKKFQPVVPEQQVDLLPEELTNRQARILKMVTQGFSSREIAEKLDISYYTVTTHIKNIYHKLQVNSRAEAIHEAYRIGLIE